jgi:hypothetical protein
MNIILSDAGSMIFRSNDYGVSLRSAIVNHWFADMAYYNTFDVEYPVTKIESTF